MRQLRTLDDARRIIAELDEQFGFDCSEAIIKKNGRFKRILARATITSKKWKPTKFEFSTIAFYLNEQAFEQLVKHEWCHAYVNCKHKRAMGHGAEFKEMCRLVGCAEDDTYFLDMVALSDAWKELKNNPSGVYNYYIECEDCKEKTYYRSKSKRWKIVKGSEPNNECRVLTCVKCKSQNLNAKKV